MGYLARNSTEREFRVGKQQYDRVTKRVNYVQEAHEKRIVWMQARGWQYVGFDLDMGGGTKMPQKILLHFRRIKDDGAARKG